MQNVSDFMLVLALCLVLTRIRFNPNPNFLSLLYKKFAGTESMQAVLNAESDVDLRIYAISCQPADTLN